jgi:predicted Zn-ribbon and HTH transcriptional regulator
MFILVEKDTGCQERSLDGENVSKCLAIPVTSCQYQIDVQATLLNACPIFRTCAQIDSRSRALTIRRQIAQMLQAGEYNAREISQALRIREKEVYEHLPHIERSFGNGLSVISKPAHCLDCGFVFRKRTRFTAPSKCPVCRSESITPPLYRIKNPSEKG